MKTVRCSALPRIMSCHASAITPEIRIDSESEPARVGTACHEIYARIVDTGNPPDLIEATARKYRVKFDELKFLAWQGWELWQKIRKDIIVVATESESMAERDEIRITGTADLEGTYQGDAFILDWKTGHKSEADYRAQLLGYAAIRYLNGAFGNIRVAIVFTRFNEHVVEEFTPEDIEAFLTDLAAILTNDTPTYNPTPDNCQYCPRAHECPARVELVGSACRDLMAISGESGTITTAKLAGFYPKTRVLKKMIDEYEAALKLELETGSLPVGDDKELALSDETRSTIRYCPEVLATYLTQEQIDGLTVTCKKKEIIDAAFENSTSLTKKEVIDHLMHDLVNAGAVTEKHFKQIDLRKIG